MRKNTKQAYAAWRAGKAARPANAIWTDGKTIYSYGTALVVQLDDDRVVLNWTRYSVTTTRHQSGLRELLAQDYGDVVLLNGLPRGVAGCQLAKRAGTLSV